MIYKNNFITSLTKQEILNKLNIISSGKVTCINNGTLLLSMRGVKSIYRSLKYIFFIKISMQTVPKNKNQLCIVVYPNFTFYFSCVFWVLIFIGSIFSSNISEVQINIEFFLTVFIGLGAFIFCQLLNIWEFLDQRKRIIKRIEESLK